MNSDLTPDDAIFEGPAMVPGMDMMDTLHLIEILDDATARDNENVLDQDPALDNERAMAIQKSNEASQRSMDRARHTEAVPACRKPGLR